MPDAFQIAIFTKVESHLGKHLYSSSINKDPQKPDHCTSFSCLLFLFFLLLVSLFWVCRNNRLSVSPLQRQNFSLGKCNYSQSKLPDRHSLKLALQKSCHICVCGLSLECRKKESRETYSFKICHCKFLPPILIFYFLKKRREAVCTYMVVGKRGEGTERERQTDRQKERETGIFLRFTRKNILLSDNAK